ncbi:MAG: hypothetical protein OZ923_01595 [Comamonadaceae bacterium]|nr:hypothetical protein [Burkholderiales bacterium]MEB2347291.1 hypothetical protein [Comamonadaceae bacterium]
MTYAVHANPASNETVERLPFSIRVVSDTQALQKAVQIRHLAYARHVPDLAQALREPEQADFSSSSVVLLAESHLDGSPLGTMRIQTNADGPLALERSLTLPPALSASTLAEATRLGVSEGRVGTLVKTALFKAFYLYCLHSDVDWMVVTGRAPVDRQYQRLLFEDVYPNLGYVPMRHVGNLPHRVLKFEVRTAQDRWAAAHHPMLKFMVETRHPDIVLDVPHAHNDWAHGTAATLSALLPPPRRLM